MMITRGNNDLLDESYRKLERKSDIRDIAFALGLLAVIVISWVFG